MLVTCCILHSGNPVGSLRILVFSWLASCAGGRWTHCRPSSLPRISDGSWQAWCAVGLIRGFKVRGYLVGVLI